jgi:hypothetical protein
MAEFKWLLWVAVAHTNPEVVDSQFLAEGASETPKR